MFKGFNLDFGRLEPQSFLEINTNDISEYDSKIKRLREDLNYSIEKVELPRNSDNSIDASQLINDWFPECKPDVFISHSHTDEQTAKRIACWLEKNFKLTTFIDSTVWGNADELLKKLDNEYCVLSRDKKGNVETYNYRMRNFTTSHVHMMLSTALNDMIYASECVIFLNTPKSVQTTEIKGEKTKSPWIYSELKTACIVEKINPREISTNILHREERIFQNSVKEGMTYNVGEQLTTFENLNSKILQQWQTSYKESINIHPLDVLYRLIK